MKVDELFRRRVFAREPERGALWLADLPARVERLARAWSITDLRPWPGLSMNLVLEGRRASREIILKIAPPPDSLLFEHAWLRTSADLAPEVLAWDPTEEALLLARCRPGETLKSFRDIHGDEAALEVICDLVTRIKTCARTAPAGTRSLGILAEGFGRLEGHVDAKDLSLARVFFGERMRRTEEQVFLHGDLHHENVLREGGSWKLIDPHGWSGPVLSEIGTMIYNPLDAWAHEPPPDLLERRVAFAAARLGSTFEEIRGWCLVKALISASWSLEDGTDPRRALAAARVLAALAS